MADKRAELYVTRRYAIPVPLGDPLKTGLASAVDRGDPYTYQDAVRGIWIPTLSAVTTPPTLGTGSVQQGDFVYHAGWVRAGFLISFGTSGAAAGNGIYQMGGLPIPLDVTGPRAGSFPVGWVHLRDSGIASRYWIAVSETSGIIRFKDPSGVEVTNAAPWVWGNNDNLRGELLYKVND